VAPGRSLATCNSAGDGLPRLGLDLGLPPAPWFAQQLLANYLIVGPLSFEATNARFKRDTEVMLTVLKEVGLKPE
jgi:hypothetical protein